MKIALVGTHNVGKTTSLYQIGVALKIHGFDNFTMLNEVVRESPYLNTKDLFLNEVWTIQTQIMKELETSKKWNHVIIDRSVFDSIIYYDVLTTPLKTINEYNRFDFISRMAWRWEKFQPYDIIFLLRPFPIETRIGKDPDRMFTPEVQQQIDDAFVRFFKTRWFKEKLVEIKEPSLKIRSQQIVEVILERIK